VTRHRMGRVLTGVGAGVLVVGLFLTWYHIDRATGNTDPTGWQTFTRLRWLVLAGALALLASAFVAKSRWVSIGCVVIGVGLVVLIFRRIVDPPAINGLSTQFGVYVALFGAIAATLGAILEAAGPPRAEERNVETGAEPADELPAVSDAAPAEPTAPSADAVDPSANER
jgi:peptidoglycan/LPS O-acetylase OafA/YrhL